MYQLIRATWHLDKQMLDVLARDSEGCLRRVTVRWMAAHGSRIPETWVDGVLKELNLKRVKTTSLDGMLRK